MAINSLYHKAHYQGSAYTLSQLPPDRGMEVAFAGRSNVGKSSAINAITNIKGLARTSKTPGRTQMINFFQLDARRCLVDLPGYGYAKVPEAVKRQWRQTLSNYLEWRQSLCGIVLVMDIRRLFQPFDLQMLEWCRARGLPVCILLTKSDKLKRGAAKQALEKVTAHLQEAFPSARAQLFSAHNRMGVEAIQAQLDRWFELDESPP
ncbi:GTP-binding protein HSR1-related protein [Nitrosococcus halophilus Nc 4]|uniref:Probable GTP-binding protein EngB n=1 Tax=Nitrosococcus halophilus (strain Nc4) TaxID=472759 RepID=D5C0V8_NITHN|nr:GTP-binding protein HSR1-related protein [Nitrosococcus halophilus Nc 4]